MQRVGKHKLISFVLLLAIAIIEPLFSISITFCSFDNSISLIPNIVNDLTPEDPHVYRRAIVETERTEISDSTWQALMLDSYKDYYRQALLFGLSENQTITFQTDLETDLEITCSATEYLVYPDEGNYVYQNLTFQNNDSPINWSDNGIILPSTIAEELWNERMPDKPYDIDELCTMAVSFNGTIKQVLAVYDVSADRLATNNFWYRNFGNVVFLPSDQFQSSTQGFRRYFFTISDNINTSLALAQTLLVFSSSLSVPDLYDNAQLSEAGIDIYSIYAALNEIQSSSISIATAVISGVLLVLSFFAFHYLVFKLLRSGKTKTILIVMILSVLFPILEFAFFSFLVPSITLNSVIVYSTTRITPLVLMAISAAFALPGIIAIVTKSSRKQSEPAQTYEVDFVKRKYIKL